MYRTRCHGGAIAGRTAAAALAVSWLLLVAQPAAQANESRLDKLTIETSQGPRSFRVEIADTPQERATGLMHRAELPSGQGMLFLLAEPGPINMWMKNTLIPLDMLFIDTEGRISRIAARTEPHSLELISSGGDVVAVLEINGGLAQVLGIEVGDRVRHDTLP